MKLPLKKFILHSGDQIITEKEALNFKNITSFGIYVSGIVNENEKQSGESTLILYQMVAKTSKQPQRLIKNYNIKI